MALTDKERESIKWYWSLDKHSRKAIDRWLKNGDAVLIPILRDGSEQIQRFALVFTPESSDEAALRIR